MPADRSKKRSTLLSPNSKTISQNKSSAAGMTGTVLTLCMLRFFQMFLPSAVFLLKNLKF